MNCGTLSDPTNGDVNLNDGTRYGDTAVYSCDAGYILSGTATRTCLSTGSWSGVAPTCNRKSLELGKEGNYFVSVHWCGADTGFQMRGDCLTKQALNHARDELV